MRRGLDRGRRIGKVPTKEIAVGRKPDARLEGIRVR